MNDHFDPYEILGIPRDADIAAIKAAAKKKAQQAHPDREGGNADAFKMVMQAREILLDADKRAQFDASGEVDRTGIDMQVKEMLVGLVTSLMDENPLQEFVHVDLLAKVRVTLENADERLAQNYRSESKAAARFRRIAARITRKNGPNFIAQHLLKKAGAAEAEMEVIESSRDVGRIAREMLLQFDYALDQEPPALGFRRFIQTPG